MKIASQILNQCACIGKMVSVTVLGKVRIGKVKGVSVEIVNKYGSAFSTDFDTNKKLVGQYSDIRSKHLNNRVAGYITRLLVSQKRREEALKLEEAEMASQESTEAQGAEVQEGPVEELEMKEVVEEPGKSVETETETKTETEAETKAEQEGKVPSEGKDVPPVAP
jgi:small subunit ribosomal protein S17e